MARRTYYIEVKEFVENVSNDDLLVSARMLLQMTKLWSEQKRAMMQQDRLKIIECQTKMAQILDAATVWRDTSGMKCKLRQAHKKARLAALAHRIKNPTTRVDVDDPILFEGEMLTPDAMASEKIGDLPKEDL